MATIQKEVASSGGDYTSLSAALTAELATISAGDDYIFNCSAFEDINKATVASGWSVAGSVTIQATGSNRHTGVRGTGYRIVISEDWAAGLNIESGNVIVDGIASKNASTNGGNGINDTLNSPGTVNQYKNCLAYDSVRGFLMFSTATHKIRNCIALGCSADGFWLDGLSYLYNSDALYCANGVNRRAWSESYLKNNYAGGNSSADYVQGETVYGSITTCASSDGTLSTTTISIANCEFTNSTAGSEDIHIAATSDLVDIATDLHSDATFAFSDDFEGDARPNGSWDVGADQYVSTTPPSPPSSLMNTVRTHSIGIGILSGIGGF